MKIESGASAAGPQLRLQLAADEQVTFLAAGNAEYDVAAKSWGAYLTPSFRGRLAQFSLRPAIVVDGDQCMLVLVEQSHQAAFDREVAARGLRVLVWLDRPDLHRRLAGT